MARLRSTASAPAAPRPSGPIDGGFQPDTTMQDYSGAPTMEHGNTGSEEQLRQVPYDAGGYDSGGIAPRTPPGGTPPPIQGPAPTPAPPIGQVGHNGTTSAGQTREQYRDAWQGSGAMGMDDLNAFLGKYGGTLESGNGTVRTPFGESIDMMVGARTGNGTPGWGGVGGGGGSQPMSGASGYSGGGGAAGAGFGAQVGGGSGSGSTNMSGGGSSSSSPMAGSELMEILRGMFPNGNFNQGVVNSRVSNASDTLSRNRKSQMATNSAIMAARGQGSGDGTYGTAAGNLEDRLGENFNDSVNEIFADESQAADSRMIQALQMATGMTIEEARNAVTMAGIESDERIGWGNIGVGHRNADNNANRNSNDFTLGLGDLANESTRNANNFALGGWEVDLGYDTLNSNNYNTQTGHRLTAEELRLRAAENAANGYVGSSGAVRRRR